MIDSIIGMIKTVLIGCLIIGAIAGVLLMVLPMIGEAIYPIEKRKRRAGEKFEKKVAKLLYKKTGYRPVRNVLLDRNDPSHPDIKTTEIDMILVTKKGIFATECKLRGDHCTIVADPANPIWTVEGAEEPEMRNAFDQNRMHIDVLKNYLNTNSIFNLVIVSTDFRLKIGGNIYNSGNDMFYDAFTTGYKMGMIKVDPVLHILQTGVKKFTKDLKRLPDVFTDAQVSDITNKLKAYEGTKEALKRHREQFTGKQ